MRKTPDYTRPLYTPKRGGHHWLLQNLAPSHALSRPRQKSRQRSRIASAGVLLYRYWHYLHHRKSAEHVACSVHGMGVKTDVPGLALLTYCTMALAQQRKYNKRPGWCTSAADDN